MALTVDDLLTEYSCDAIVETGCFLGDTTSYLARRYPNLPVYSCDNDARHASFTQRRLRAASNVTVTCVDSVALVTAVVARHERPLFFLDAHRGAQWPLGRELAVITTGIVVIHDFDIGHPRFAFDTYQGMVCGPAMLAAMPTPPARYFTADPQADYPLPCLQTGRRAGVGFVAIGLNPDLLDAHPHLIGHDTPAAAAVMVHQ